MEVAAAVLFLLCCAVFFSEYVGLLLFEGSPGVVRPNVLAAAAAAAGAAADTLRRVFR